MHNKENIECLIEYCNWIKISIKQILSEKFMREFHDKLDWNYISSKIKLSEDFIREFKDKVNWHCISDIKLYQKTSLDNWDRILKNKPIFVNL